MQLIQHIGRLFGYGKNRKPHQEQHNINNIHARSLTWIGKDSLERQYFYEKWTSLESWYVYHQGLPLLLGRDPEDEHLDTDTNFINQRSELWEHINNCVQRRVSPFLQNPAEGPLNWQAEPVELYRWAIAARIAVPEELDALLAFISTTIKPSKSLNVDHQDNSRQEDEQSAIQLAREQVLSVMLTLLLQKYYEKSYRDVSGLREDIIESIYNRSDSFFNQKEPPLSRPVLHDLIDRSLEQAGLIRI